MEITRQADLAGATQGENPQTPGLAPVAQRVFIEARSGHVKEGANRHRAYSKNKR